MEKRSMLTFIEDAGKDKNGHSLGKYKCECGKETIARKTEVKCFRTKSCGCLIAKTQTKHGLHLHPLYKIWVGMKNRCYNPNIRNYRFYGARGVTVCKQWIYDFKSFYNWAIENGWEPGLQLDKDIKSGRNKIYSPKTCCFITANKNKSNTRLSVKITFNGETHNQAEWCRRYGIAENTFRNRIEKGWPINVALTKPPIKTGKKKSNV